MRNALKISTLLLLSCSLSSNAIAQEDSAIPVNETGEEIFSGDYLPTSVLDKGLPYLIGQPSGGLAIPTEALGFPQDVFDKKWIEKNVPAGEIRQMSLPPVPVRSDYEGQNEEDNETPNNFEKLLGKLQKRYPDDVAKMKAHFVNVGQGDATILEFSCQIAVIDVGGEFSRGVNGGKLFFDYLKSFFAARPHLKRNIDLLVLTHPHKDHIYGLNQLKNQNSANPIKVLNLIDNGQSGSRGSLAKQTEFRSWARNKGAKYSAIELARQVTSTGVTNAAIDPIVCPDIDPVVTAFWGGVNEKVSNEAKYGNPNNHSVVVKVDFGEASFLFTGDLEDKGEEDLRFQYRNNLSAFDVDVYQVSHHGADDDTSDELIKIMSPEIAVFSMGDPSKRGSATAHDHGHPRKGVVDLLQKTPHVVTGKRIPSKFQKVFRKQEVNPQRVKISKALYGTAWDGTVVLTATSDGKFEVE